MEDNNTVNLDDYMPIMDAVRALGRSRHTIYSWCRALPGEEPKLRCRRVAGRVLVERAGVEAMKERRGTNG